MVAAILCLADDTAPGLIGAAGLDAHHGGVVVGTAGQQHLIGGVLPQVGVLIGLAQLHGVVLYDGGKRRLLHGIFRHDGHIPGRGVGVIAVQAGGVGKMGAGAAQRFGLVVHHLHKGGDIPRHKIRHTAAAHISRQDHRGFVTALHQRRGQKLPDGQLLPHDKPAQRGIGAVQHVLDPHGVFGRFAIQVLYILQHHYRGHYFGE